MSSRNCFNVLKVAVIVVSILDLIFNIYNLVSAGIAKRDGVYNRYEWEWNVFFVCRIAIAAVVLLGVTKAKPKLLVISCIFNGAILAVLLYAVAVGRYQYYRCERDLCGDGGICDVCYLKKNYADYGLTRMWSGESHESSCLSRNLSDFTVLLALVFVKLILVIAYLLMSNKSKPRENFHMRTTV